MCTDVSEKHVTNFRLDIPFGFQCTPPLQPALIPVQIPPPSLLNPEDRGSMFLRNISIRLQDYTMSRSRIQNSQQSGPCDLRIILLHTSIGTSLDTGMRRDFHSMDLPLFMLILLSVSCNMYMRTSLSRFRRHILSPFPVILFNYLTTFSVPRIYRV
jgi:hypothetical protein